MKQFFLLVLPLLFTSCAVHLGMITPTSTNLRDKQVEYSDIAVGYSKVFYVFNFGGFGKDALVNEAKRNLYLSYPLQAGQSLENLTLDFKVARIFFYTKMEAIVIADVLQGDTSIKITYSKNYKNFLNANNLLAFNNFSLNESVYCMNRGPMYSKIIKVGKRRATVFYINKRGAIKIKNVWYSGLYKMNNDLPLELTNGFKVGDNVIFTDLNRTIAYGGAEGKIIGINSTGAIVKTAADAVQVDFTEIKVK